MSKKDRELADAIIIAYDKVEQSDIVDQDAAYVREMADLLDDPDTPAPIMIFPSDEEEGVEVVIPPTLGFAAVIGFIEMAKDWLFKMGTEDE